MRVRHRVYDLQFGPVQLPASGARDRHRRRDATLGAGDGAGIDEQLPEQFGSVESVADATGATSATSASTDATSDAADAGASGSTSADAGASPKRPRGRPKSSAKPKAKASRRADDSEPVRIRVDQAARAAKPAAAPKVGPAGDIQAALVSSTLIVGMVEQMLVGSIGPHAALNAIERPMIIDPAARILARSDAEALAKYAAIMDPITLAAGLAIWGFRVWTTTRRQETDDRAPAGGGTSAAPAERPLTPPEPSAAAPVAETNGHRTQAPNGVAPVPLAIVAHFEDSSLGGF